MKMVIATGGTGGHIYPAIALADVARNRYKDFDVLFIGNDDRMEKQVVPAHGYRFIGIHASGLSGSIISKVKALVQMMNGIHQASVILKKEKPDIVIGFGGYVSAPVIIAASRLGIKTMIHEQNSIVGAANKAVAKRVDHIVICYDKCFEVFDKEKTRLLGNPRASLIDSNMFNEEYFKSLGLSLNKKTVLIVMGSLGSSSINSRMEDILSDIHDVQILYVTGKDNYEEMKNKFLQDNIFVVDYVDQLAILSHIDLIVCRGGATTLAEITVMGVPAILIPSPYVAHNHQYYNAKVLADQNAAYLLEEKDLDGNTLGTMMNDILHHEIKREAMSAQMRKLGFPNAADDILNWIDK